MIYNALFFGILVLSMRIKNKINKFRLFYFYKYLLNHSKIAFLIIIF